MSGAFAWKPGGNSGDFLHTFPLETEIFALHTKESLWSAYVFRLARKVKEKGWCLEPESNRYDRLGSADFKSAVSTNFTIEADR